MLKNTITLTTSVFGAAVEPLNTFAHSGCFFVIGGQLYQVESVSEGLVNAYSIANCSSRTFPTTLSATPVDVNITAEERV